MDYLTENVAVNLKRIRQSKGMSLDQASEQTGQQEYALADRKGNGEPVAWRAREDYERPAD